MKTDTNNNICAAVALLSRFNWFDVTIEESTTGKTSHLCAINIALRESGTLQFDRQFTYSIFTDRTIKDIIAVSDSEFHFLDDGGTVYKVEAKNKALADPDTANGNKDVHSTLIDWSRSQIDEAGNMLIVLDLRKLGRISDMEWYRIKSYMNIFLGGLSITKQICRTIYIEPVDDERIIIGLYNLEKEEKMTAKKCNWYLSFTDDEEEKLRRLVEVARDELEAIPLF